MQAGQHVLQHRHRPEDADVLEGAGHAEPGTAMRRHIGNIPAGEIDPPGAGRDDAGNQVEQRGLAGAVGADHRVDAALGHREVDRVDRDQPGKTAGEPGRGQQWREAHAARLRMRQPSRPRGRNSTATTMISPLNTSRRSEKPRSNSGSSVRIQAPEHRCERRADAAEQGVGEDGHRRLEAIFVGADEARHMRTERAGDAGQHGRGDQRAHAVAGDIDAHHLCRRLVLAHRLHRAADGAAPDQPQPGGGGQQQSVDHPGLGALRDAVQPERAAEEIDIDVDRAQHFAEADGGDREVDAGQPQRRHADRQGERHRHHAGRRQHERRTAVSASTSSAPRNRRRAP